MLNRLLTSSNNAGCYSIYFMIVGIEAQFSLITTYLPPNTQSNRTKE